MEAKTWKNAPQEEEAAGVKCPAWVTSEEPQESQDA